MTLWRIVMPDGYVVTPPPKRWLDKWDARVRAELGKPVRYLGPDWSTPARVATEAEA